MHAQPHPLPRRLAGLAPSVEHDERAPAPTTTMDDGQARPQRLAASSLVLAFATAAIAVSYAIGALPL